MPHIASSPTVTRVDSASHIFPSIVSLCILPQLLSYLPTHPVATLLSYASTQLLVLPLDNVDITISFPSAPNLTSCSTRWCRLRSMESHSTRTHRQAHGPVSHDILHEASTHLQILPTDSTRNLQPQFLFPCTPHMVTPMVLQSLVRGSTYATNCQRKRPSHDDTRAV
jgi:hypothetical protein